MLTGRAVGAVAAAALALATLTGTAWADSSPSPGSGVFCPPNVTDCRLHAGDGTPGTGTPSNGSTGGPGGGGTQPTCTLHGKTVPCNDPQLGWFNSTDGCYWLLMNPQPPTDDPSWKLANGIPSGWKPADGGKLYTVTCTQDGSPVLRGGTTWSKNPPPGYGGGPDLAAMAQEAVAKMRLLGPAIGVDPKPGGRGTVAVPVWLWNRKGPGTTGPNSASVTAGAVTVTATARVDNVVWDMGDGQSVTCASAGTPYKAAYGMAESPTCGYRYSSTSSGQPDGKFHVVATTTWKVHWAGGGQQGDITTTRTADVRLTIGELQVLN